MENLDALKEAMRHDIPLDKRTLRADRTRAIALSPARILLRLAMVPVTTVALTVSIFVATSPYEQEDSLRHLIAMAGCDAAGRLGMANIAVGAPGYHASNDTDGNGIACEDPVATFTAAPPPEQTPGQIAAEALNTLGAKFLKPPAP